MKRADAAVILAAAAAVVPFLISPAALAAFEGFNRNHGFAAGFLKFAVLATFGECLALRIREGVYNKTGFGVLPKAVVWGFLGMGIYGAFVIFSAGTPKLVEYAFEIPRPIPGTSFSSAALCHAVGISICMNLVFAPVMMTLHRMTDMHISSGSGRLSILATPMNSAELLAAIDWKVMWGFVFKKSIPLFWIPAHTITFLLPQEYRILFAALLGVALGLILALAAQKN